MTECMREEYYMASAGDCLGSLVPPGAVLHCVPGSEIKPLDLVMVFIDPSATGPWAKFREKITAEGGDAIAKIFLAAYVVSGETWGWFGQLNPPAAMPIPMSAIQAVDRINFHAECTGLEREAMEALMHFVMPPSANREAA